MRILGIIAEYNPFHNGHLYQLNQAKAITGAKYSIAVMSGNYVQRGEPAIIDKWKRTEMALSCGIDMVLELPVLFSAAGADFFAQEAIRILNACGIVTDLAFGAETDNLPLLKQTAQLLAEEPAEFKSLLKSFMQQGLSFPAARMLAVNGLRHVSLPPTPNNILATEYLKAIIQTHSSLSPTLIQRIGSGFHDTNINKSISSATAIRQAIYQSDETALALPLESQHILSMARKAGLFPVFTNYYSDLLLYRLRTETPDSLSRFLDISEGLENRILQASNQAFRISEMIGLIKTKRYTYTRIQRALLHILLGIESRTMEQAVKAGGSQFIRVLGFRRDSQFLLGQLKKNAHWPLVVNVKKDMQALNATGLSVLRLENTATDIYMIKAPSPNHRHAGQEYSRPVVVL